MKTSRLLRKLTLASFLLAVGMVLFFRPARVTREQSSGALPSQSLAEKTPRAAAGSVPARADAFFQPVPAAVSDVLPGAPSARVALRSRYVRSDLEFLEQPESPVHNGDRVRPVHLQLFDDVGVDFFVDQTHYLEPGVFTTVGHTASELSLVVFAHVHNSVVATVVDPMQGQFTLEPTARGGVYRIYQHNPRSFVCGALPAADGVAAASAPVGVDPGSEPHPAADDVIISGSTTNDFWSGLSSSPSGTRVPVLALYNADMGAKAVALFGSIDGLRARMEAGIAMTNAVLLRARATAYLELVGLAQITFNEPAIPSSDTIMDLVSQSADYRTMQSRFRPTLTTYIVASDSDQLTFSGVAAYNGPANAIRYGDLNSTAAPHEFGHNFGMDHNAEDALQNLVAPYAHGWRVRTNPLVGDVMSYPFTDTSALTFQLPVYSEPGALFQGQPLGNAATADNARVAREGSLGMPSRTIFQFGAASDNWIANLSTRGYVGTDSQVLIAGLIVSGSQPKQIVLRGVGPSLGKFGIQQPLANPRLQLYSGSTVIAENDNWQTDARAAEVQAHGLAPSDPSESALLYTLAPGAYTVILSGVGNTAGVALVEAYEMDADRSRLTYWNSNQATTARSEHFDAPLEFTYDFGGTFRNLPILFQVGATPGKYLLAARRDANSPAIDPYLQIRRVPKGQNPYVNNGAATVAFNDNWRDSADAAKLALSGINGLGDATTAVVTVDTTADADYWLVVGPGDPNQLHPSSGILDISIYTLTGSQTVGEENRLANVATRGVLGTGERVMIAGFIVGGASSRTVAIRATGPSLAAFGIPNTAANPKFTVFDSGGKVIASNDDWARDTTAPMVRDWGLAPSSASEAAMLLTVAPGAYTVVVENTGGDGVGLVEVYEVR